MFRIELPATADAAELAQKVQPFTVCMIVLTTPGPLLDTRDHQERGPLNYHGVQPPRQGRGQHRDACRAITGNSWP